MRVITILLFFISFSASAQTKKWQVIEKAFGPLPPGVHVYYTDYPTNDTIPFKAYYVSIPLKKDFQFFTDTTMGRRLSPSEFYEKNKKPFITVNGTFFSFSTNQNLNLVMNDGKALALNNTPRGRNIFPSAIGISEKGEADVAWTITDSTDSSVEALQSLALEELTKPKKWKVKTAIGGGPVLVQNGKIQIYNNEEKKFGGKGLYDRHPRTAMGYTKDGDLIIMVVEGRNQEAGGADLVLLAQLLKEVGCVEALNLDGGGSSCLLINGIETIKPSDKVQRKVPAVFMVSQH